jgi:hypothetical protein
MGKCFEDATFLTEGVNLVAAAKKCKADAAYKATKEVTNAIGDAVFLPLGKALSADAAKATDKVKNTDLQTRFLDKFGDAAGMGKISDAVLKMHSTALKGTVDDQSKVATLILNYFTEMQKDCSKLTGADYTKCYEDGILGLEAIGKAMKTDKFFSKTDAE